MVLAVLETMLEVLNPSVEFIDLVLLLMQYGGVVQKSCSLHILAGKVDLLLHEPVNFLLQKVKSFFVMES